MSCSAQAGPGAATSPAGSEFGLEGFPGTSSLWILLEIRQPIVEQFAVVARDLDLVGLKGLPEFADQLETVSLR